jgi:hypothetical protein
LIMSTKLQQVSPDTGEYIQVLHGGYDSWV